MSEIVADSELEELFPGNGEMAQRLRAVDWSKTPLGPVSKWPEALQMMVRFLLANRFPLLLWWGPEYVQIYNDAYVPVPGLKHPRSVGQRASECWTEIWPVIGPLIDTPFRGGPATWMEDIELEVHRHGFTEETHFTIAYSPVPDATAPSGIGGVLATVHETTQQVIQERRVRILRDLGIASLKARSVDEACATAADVFGNNPKDVPFALIYLLEGEQNAARLTASAGVANGGQCAPALMTADAERPWPLAEVIKGEQPILVSDLRAQFPDISAGPSTTAPNQAMAVPIRSHLAGRPLGMAVFGISPLIAVDEFYQSFFDLAAAQIATAISNAHAYEEERQRAEALAAIDRAKTTFFSNVSHEFRTPLTLILGPLEEALRDTTAEEDPSLRERLELMRRNGLRLQKLVNTLLDFSRIEAGRIEANYEPTDLPAFTGHLAGMFESAMERAGLRLVIECPAAAESAYIDRDMWEKIVMNLLSNALKFTLDGEIVVSVRQKDNAFELTVRDTGVGIPADEMPRLFERFHRIRHAQARTHEGTGIGLALVQELVRLHGGQVRATSEAGRGTEFTIRIPAGTAHLPPDRINAGRTLASTALGATPYIEEALRWLPDNRHSESRSFWLDTYTTNESATATMPDLGARILIADDNADMREYLRVLLEQYWSVETVTDGTAALRRVRENRPELVISDVMMPGLDGLSFLREVRADELTKDLPVILLSARVGEEAAVEALAAGADVYLVKPFAARELIAYVAGHLQLQRVRRQSLEALRSSEQKFSAAFEQSPLALTITSLTDGRLVEVNETFVRLTGYSRAEAVGRTVDELKLWVDPDLRREGLTRLRSGESVAGTKARFRTKTGAERTGLVGSKVIEINGRPHALSSVADVTNLIRAEERLSELNAILRETDRRKDEFLAMLAHELRNPLSAVRNAVAIASLDEAHRARALEIARRQTEQLGRLIDDLLDVARVTQGRISLSKLRVSLADVIRQAVESTHSFIAERRLTLEVSSPERPVFVDADRVRLEQVFVNLLTNAGKYTDPGGRIAISTEIRDKTAVVRVRDTGIGISSDLLPRIWDLFVQANPGLDRSQGGLGIGLTITRRLVELHGGSVVAHSAGPGKGAEFVVTLPIVSAPGEESAAIHSDRTSQRSVRVLLVEDNADAAESMTLLLELLGHRVRSVGDGIAALEAARANTPDVMLVDIGLPGIDGYEVARRVKREPALREVILVALTGYGREDDKQTAMAAGFDYHLVKPIAPSALDRLVSELGQGRTSKKPPMLQ